MVKQWMLIRCCTIKYKKDVVSYTYHLLKTESEFMTKLEEKISPNSSDNLLLTAPDYNTRRQYNRHIFAQYVLSDDDM